MVSPACFHAFIIGLPELVWTCQGAVQLLTHLLSRRIAQGVTGGSLDKKNPGIAAAARIHCRERERRQSQVQVSDGGHHQLDTVNEAVRSRQVTQSDTAYVKSYQPFKNKKKQMNKTVSPHWQQADSEMEQRFKTHVACWTVKIKMLHEVRIHWLDLKEELFTALSYVL